MILYDHYFGNVRLSINKKFSDEMRGPASLIWFYFFEFDDPLRLGLNIFIHAFNSKSIKWIYEVVNYEL